MVEPISKPAGAGVLDALAQFDIPEPLRASVERHQANLRRLMDTLKSTGMDEARIEASIATVVESYKAELLAAMKALMKPDV